PLLELLGLHHRIGAFEPEDRADGQLLPRALVALRGLPLGDVLAQVVAGADYAQLAHPLEGAVPGDLALADRIHAIGRVVALDRLAFALHVRHDLEDRDRHAGLAPFR